jgi:hypothetical protein
MSRALSDASPLSSPSPSSSELDEEFSPSRGRRRVDSESNTDDSSHASTRSSSTHSRASSSSHSYDSSTEDDSDSDSDSGRPQPRKRRRTATPLWVPIGAVVGLAMLGVGVYGASKLLAPVEEPAVVGTSSLANVVATSLRSGSSSGAAAGTSKRCGHSLTRRAKRERLIA